MSTPALGAHWDGDATTFTVYSAAADRVELAVDEGPGGAEDDDPARGPGPGGGWRRVDLTPLGAPAGHLWSTRLPGVGPGHRYGFRVHGPWDPGHGLRCNPAKLLIDPYALAIEGRVALHPAVYAHEVRSAAAGSQADRHADGTSRHDYDRPSALDSAPYVPHSVVVDPAFDWDGDGPPRIPWDRTVIYELHVRGFTKAHPAVPEELRGTYGALAHPAVIEYLLSLGVTTLELLPIQAVSDELHLLRKRLTNYWGYSTVGFFAPHAAYARARGGGQVAEFKAMIKALHAAGLEVVLDIVYNHTAEGGQAGPSLSLRGFDQSAYYRLDGHGHDVDYTGCGNTVDLRSGPARGLVLDSLRYWVNDMHVDGFRFDLAPALARESEDFDPEGAFLTELGEDPVLSKVKLIAEPWDLGPGGWQTGRFPRPWVEWNDHFRDDVRDFWRGWSHGVRPLAIRLLGSRDLFADRAPLASVNFITAHDGFTAHDLVSYDGKHNRANGEGGRDGTDNNRSWNHGVEGPTRRVEVQSARIRTLRNLIATLLLSQGVPMITAGDEFGRTQRGNNNAYCQDNAVSWVNWTLTDWQRELLETVRRLVALRAAHPALRRPTPYLSATAGKAARHVTREFRWLRPDGKAMTEADWSDPALRTVVARLAHAGDVVVIGVHAGAEPTWVHLPIDDAAYDLVLDTRSAGARDTIPYRIGAGQRLDLAPRTVVLLTAAPR